MDPLLSHKQQRAADIRDAIQEYHAARNPWGPDHRAHAVFLGVQRNNARRGFNDEDDEGKGCCCYLLWLLLLTAVCVAVWYCWMKAIDGAHKLAMDFPALASIGGKQCQESAEAGTFVQMVNCTLNESLSFAKGLALVFQGSYDDYQPIVVNGLE